MCIIVADVSHTQEEFYTGVDLTHKKISDVHPTIRLDLPTLVLHDIRFINSTLLELFI